MYPDCEFNLGNLYLKTRKFEEAERRFRTGAKQGHELSFVNLLIFLDEKSRLGEAQTLALEAIIKFPSNPEFLFQYANILGQQVGQQIFSINIQITLSFVSRPSLKRARNFICGQYP